MRCKPLRPHADSTLVARALGELLNAMPTPLMDDIVADILWRAHGLSLAEVRRRRLNQPPHEATDADDDQG